MAAEAIAISLSAKFAVALTRNAAVNLSPLFGIRSDIAGTAQELELLRAFLRFADSHQGTNALDSIWIKQVRETAFELEDIADECCYLSSNGHSWVNVRSWFDLSRKLRKARERLRQLSTMKEQFGIRLTDDPALPIATISSRMLASNAHFIKKQEIVGFDDHQMKLLDWVQEETQTRRTTIAVCGMGGVGKTTLVTRLYKEVATSHFECAAWVAVSQTFTINDLLRKILKELGCNSSASCSNAKTDTDTDYRSLMEAVQGHLFKRRYLVVLDDIWDPHLWGKILNLAFPDDATGSRVVITTRSNEVAKAATRERIMMLEPLQLSEAWTLFCNITFRDVPNRTCPSHLEELATSMLKRCHGLPLAIVSIGELLALKERTEFAWRNARNGLVWDKSNNNLGIGEAASILNLSIDDLPHNLKKCFLSCGVYPEDLWIKRKMLIRKWVAQGFVQDKPGQCTAEDVADDYLDQLIQRNLIRPVVTNEFGRAKRCLIHDLIRELIIHRSREEEGYYHFPKSKVAVDSNARIRHLVVDRCEEMDNQHVPQLPTLRTFNAFGSELHGSLLSHFRLLTMLNLWFIAMKKLPDSVTNLHNLRYIGVRATLLEELPKELGKLQKLQILDAKLSMVQRLPSSIAKLRDLRHLVVLTRETADLMKPFPGKAVGVPEGLENLTSLQTLKYVQAHKNMVTSLANLTQLRSLELSALNASLIVDLSSSISKMSCLLRLGLEIEPRGDLTLDLESISPPPLKLQKLTLNGRLARGKLPQWTCSLTKLVQLRLRGSHIAQDSLMILAALPGLVNLSLITAYHDRSMIFGSGSFLNLRKLTLEDLPNLHHIEFQEGCLVNLRDMAMGLCNELTETPKGMENLVRMKNLELYGMPTEFVAKLKEQNCHAGYHNPASSDFYQAPRFLRLVRFVRKK